MKWVIAGGAFIGLLATCASAGWHYFNVVTAPNSTNSEVVDFASGAMAFSPTAMDDSLTGLWMALPIAENRDFVLLEKRANARDGVITYFANHTGPELEADLKDLEPMLIASFYDVQGHACSAIKFSIPEGSTLELVFRVENHVLLIKLPDHGCQISSWARQDAVTPQAPPRPTVDRIPSSPVSGVAHTPEELLAIYHQDGITGLKDKLPIYLADGSAIINFDVGPLGRNVEIWGTLPDQETRAMNAQLSDMNSSGRELINAMVSGILQGVVCQAIEKSGADVKVEQIDIHLTTPSGENLLDVDIDSKGC